MMKNTKRSSKRKGKMNKKEYKKWLGLLCAMIGLCVILLSVYYWRIRETANNQHSYLQIEASEEQFQDKTGYIEVREMEQQFIVDENELTEFNVMFRKLEQQAEEPVQVELLKATDREQIQKWEIDGRGLQLPDISSECSNGRNYGRNVHYSRNNPGKFCYCSGGDEL